MEQLILHLLGDYIFQTNWMATEKIKRSFAALTHAIVYSIPFLLLEPSVIAFMVILWSHFFIDRFRLARYVVFAKNWITGWVHVDTGYHEGYWKNTFDKATLNTGGYPVDMPPFMWVWLLIIADNTLHLTINYLALRYL